MVKRGFRNGSSRANGALLYYVRCGERMSGLSLTLAVVFSTSQACYTPQSREAPSAGTKQKGRFQAGRHHEVNRHNYIPLDHIVTFWGADGYVIAAEATAV